MIQISNTLTGWANILFVVTMCIGCAFYWRWVTAKHINSETRSIVIDWALCDIAVGVRIGWWVFALALAPDAIRGYDLNGESINYTYNLWFVENKHFIAIPTSLAYLYGQANFISRIEWLSRFQKNMIMLLAVAVTSLIVLLGF